MDAIKRLIEQAPAKLSAGGRLIMEISPEQLEAVREMAQKHFPDADVGHRKDLLGLPRCLIVVHKGNRGDIDVANSIILSISVLKGLSKGCLSRRCSSAIYDGSFTDSPKAAEIARILAQFPNRSFLRSMSLRKQGAGIQKAVAHGLGKFAFVEIVSN